MAKDTEQIEKLISLVKEHYEKEILRAEERLETRISDVKSQIDKVSQDAATRNGDLKNQIETVEGKANKKLDGIDQALRGNGRVGIFEQLRNHRVMIRVAFVCISLLFGFKLMSLSLDDLINRWIPEKKQVDTRPAVTNTHTTTIPSAPTTNSSSSPNKP